MHYFNGIEEAGRKLAYEAGKLLDTSKNLKESMDRVIHLLNNSFSNSQLEEIFEDADEMWIEGFTEDYLNEIGLLEKYCKKVKADCNDRKSKLDHALIWG
jgi:hypothetical protein